MTRVERIRTHRHPRVFLFLQGPHGPFFNGLRKHLVRSGAEVWRVGFNAGDSAFWRDRKSYIPFLDPPDAWPETCARLLEAKAVADLVLYGDARPIHAAAIEEARKRDVTIHVFEEGYLRPYWVTYERNGSKIGSFCKQIIREQFFTSDFIAVSIEQ